MILKIDADNQIAESNETNNVLVSANTFTVTASSTTNCSNIYSIVGRNSTCETPQREFRFGLSKFSIRSNGNIKFFFNDGGLGFDVTIVAKASTNTPQTGATYDNCNANWVYYTGNGVRRRETGATRLLNNVNFRAVYFGSALRPDSFRIEFASNEPEFYLGAPRIFGTYVSTGNRPADFTTDCTDCVNTDRTPPTITNCPTTTLYNSNYRFTSSTSTSELIAALGIGVSDNCTAGRLEIAYNQNEFDKLNDNQLNISILAIDNADNQSRCNFVIERTPPVNASYCASKSAAPWTMWVANTTFGSINNTSEKFKDYATLGYSDYTNLTTTVTRGQSYPLSITPGLSYPGLVPSAFCRVWIDFNDSKTFEVNELVLEKTNSNPMTSSVLIPVTAATGNLRMRVSMKSDAYPTACESFASGEVEDYTINIGVADPCAGLSVTTRNVVWKGAYLDAEVGLSGGTPGQLYVATYNGLRNERDLSSAYTAGSVVSMDNFKNIINIYPNRTDSAKITGFVTKTDGTCPIPDIIFRRPTSGNCKKYTLQNYPVVNSCNNKTNSLQVGNACEGTFYNADNATATSKYDGTLTINGTFKSATGEIATINWVNYSPADESPRGTLKVGSNPVIDVFRQGGSYSIETLQDGTNRLYITTTLIDANSKQVTLSVLLTNEQIGSCGTTDPCLTDATPPVFQNCPANIALTTTTTTAAATWTAPTATDNCTATPSVSSTQNSGFAFPIGSTTVTYTATDAKNNRATCSFNVVVTKATTGGSDIALSLAATPSVYRQFTNNTYRISAQNTGSQAFTNVKIKFTNPLKTVGGSSVTASTGTFQAYCPGGIQCQEWTIPTLAGNSTATIDITFFVLDATLPLVATATLLSSTPADLTVANNTATVTLNPAAAAATGSGLALSRQTPTQFLPVVVQSVEPTLVETEVFLSVESIIEIDVNFTIFNTLGKLMQSEKRKIEKGQNRLQFDVFDLPSGVYLILPNTTSARNVPMKFIKM